MENPAREYTRTVWLEGDTLCLLDQRELPYQRVILRLTTVEEAVRAIGEMAVRGAGTIGVAGGFAMALAALTASGDDFQAEIEQAASRIASARPTAKNLSYAVERVLAAVQGAATGEPAAVEDARHQAMAEAGAILADCLRMTERIAQAGVDLLPKEKAVLTHCNAGWLAYSGWGTALAPIYLAHSRGQPVFVYATETRPRGQGARLTTWELAQSGVPHALIADTAAGSMLASGEIGLVIVGADRIAANGDTANKIGTYTLAVLAKEHRIPFYVAAPSPTFDPDCPDGSQIPIEERDEAEVLEVRGPAAAGTSKPAGHGGHATVRVATPGVQVRNPAFDVTPARFITAFITEWGLIPPTTAAIAGFLASSIPGHFHSLLKNS